MAAAHRLQAASAGRPCQLVTNGHRGLLGSSLVIPASSVHGLRISPCSGGAPPHHQACSPADSFAPPHVKGLVGPGRALTGCRSEGKGPSWQPSGASTSIRPLDAESATPAAGRRRQVHPHASVLNDVSLAISGFWIIIVSKSFVLCATASSARRTRRTSPFGPLDDLLPGHL